MTIYNRDTIKPGLYLYYRPQWACKSPVHVFLQDGEAYVRFDSRYRPQLLSEFPADGIFESEE